MACGLPFCFSKYKLEARASTNCFEKLSVTGLCTYQIKETKWLLVNRFSPEGLARIFIASSPVCLF